MGIITRAVTSQLGRREPAFFVRKVRGARSEQNTLANMHAKLAMTDGPTVHSSTIPLRWLFVFAARRRQPRCGSHAPTASVHSALRLS